MKTARQIAVELLLEVNNNGGYSNIVLDKALKNSEIPKEEKGFCSALFYGVLENKLLIDHVIKKYSKVKINKISKEVMEILRISIYQLLFMENIPISAVVNEGVKLTKTFRVASASGFVNAILRGFIRDEKKIPFIDKKHIDSYLSVKYSCNIDIIKLLLSQYDKKEVEAFVKYCNCQTGSYIKVNTTKTSADSLAKSLLDKGIMAKKDTSVENCIYIKNQGAVANIDEFRDGLFHIEDKSSQMCVRLVAAKSTERILDTCSAPGGKTFAMAEDMDGKGEIISCDIHEHKIKLIDDGAKRLGLKNVFPRLNDAAVFNEELGLFDKVLCDVPCSGLGIMGKKPEIKYKDPKDFEDLPKIQYNILKNSSQYLKVGGILVYSTCTINKNENEKVIQRFLEENENYAPLFLEGHKDGSFMTTFLPMEYDCDGFFTATLVKKK
ncbi:MAG: 16S rRNA (cytosine(967)-C(5))-methyltransferase RsmB [Oscillospiraceae bacterium]